MRSANRLATLLLAVALLAGGLLVAVEATLAALDRPDLLLDRTGWYVTLTTTRLADPAVRAVTTTVILLGIVILTAELRRWRPERLRVAERDGWYLHRRSVQRRLAGAARAVPGVRRTRVRIHRGGAGWRSRVTATGDPTARAAVEFAVRQELDRLAAPLPARVDVRLDRRRRTV